MTDPLADLIAQVEEVVLAAGSQPAAERQRSLRMLISMQLEAGALAGAEVDDQEAARLCHLATLLAHLREHELGLRVLRDGAARSPDPARRARLAGLQGVLLAEAGRLTEARTALREALVDATGAPAAAARIQSNLATLSVRLGDPEQARICLGNAETLGARDPGTAVDHAYARLQIALLREDAVAAATWVGALAAASDEIIGRLPGRHPAALAAVADLAYAKFRLAVLTDATEQAPRSASVLGEAARLIGAVLGEDHPRTLTTRIHLAECVLHVALARRDRAEAVRVQADARHTAGHAARLLGADHPQTIAAEANAALAGLAVAALARSDLALARSTGHSTPAGPPEGAGSADNVRPAGDAGSAGEARFTGNTGLAGNTELAGNTGLAGNAGSVAPVRNAAPAGSSAFGGSARSAGNAGSVMAELATVAGNAGRILGRGHPLAVLAEAGSALAELAAARAGDQPRPSEGRRVEDRLAEASAHTGLVFGVGHSTARLLERGLTACRPPAPAAQPLPEEIISDRLADATLLPPATSETPAETGATPATADLAPDLPGTDDGRALIDADAGETPPQTGEDETPAELSTVEPQPKEDASAPQPNAGTTELQPDASTSAPQPDASTSTSQPDASTSAPQPNASTSTPQPDASTSTPQSDDGAGDPGSDAGAGAPRPDSGDRRPPPEAERAPAGAGAGEVGRLAKVRERDERERTWDALEKIRDEGGMVRGMVVEAVKGGLVLDVGVRAFLPASLVEMRRVRDLQPFVGRELEAKVLELDRARGNVVLSRRAWLEQNRSATRGGLLTQLQAGQIRKGIVSSVVNFGAFVDLGGVDGLISVAELAWTHHNHPSEVVEIGQEVEVEVLDVDQGRERISLSLKATQQDPWPQFARAHPIGQIVAGRVTKLLPFGAFLRVDGLEGLVHVSELADRHVAAPDEVVRAGMELLVKVTDIDLQRRRISLSLKQANAEFVDGEENFDPVTYGMANTYDVEGNYIYPDGFDPETADWMPGFEAQREAWERQYAEAHSRWEAHGRQVRLAREGGAAPEFDGRLAALRERLSDSGRRDPG